MDSTEDLDELMEFTNNIRSELSIISNKMILYLEQLNISLDERTKAGGNSRELLNRINETLILLHEYYIISNVLISGNLSNKEVTELNKLAINKNCLSSLRNTFSELKIEISNDNKEYLVACIKLCASFLSRVNKNLSDKEVRL